MGRKLTTGRFETRAELVREVWWRHLKTSAAQADIAVACRVSPCTVGTILTTREGYDEHLRSQADAKPQG